MEVSKDQFPVVVQAYEIIDNREAFIAEQVVHSQAEVNTFTNRFAGKLIKARQMTSTELNRGTQTTTATSTTHRKRSSAGAIILAIIIILVILIIIGIYTGWIQRTFGIDV